MQKGYIYEANGAWHVRFRLNGKQVSRKLADYNDQYRTKRSVRPLADEIIDPLNQGREVNGPMTNPGVRSRRTLLPTLTSYVFVTNPTSNVEQEPMTLFELQEWLGHSSPEATQHYVKTTPTKMAKSYADAGYFARNLRAIEVLIDQESVRNGRAASEPWKFYDLGHGYCTYDFFEQCPHRMACAKCSFYLPKDSTKVLLIEAKTNLLRLRQDIPLGEAELSAVEDGLTAYEQLLAKLADVPTPAGPTPRQLGCEHLVRLEVGEQPRSDRRLGPSLTFGGNFRKFSSTARSLALFLLTLYTWIGNIPIEHR
jgi:hypothetical protein